MAVIDEDRTRVRVNRDHKYRKYPVVSFSICPVLLARDLSGLYCKVSC